MPRVGGAALITDRDSKILLVRHAYGRRNWELPGGNIENGESPVEGTVREVLEETGLSVTPTDLTGIYYDREADFLHFVVRCMIAGSGASPRPDDTEVNACAFWPRDTLPRPISDFTLLRIRDGLVGVSYPLPTVVGPRTWFEDSADGASPTPVR